MGKVDDVLMWTLFAHSSTLSTIWPVTTVRIPKCGIYVEPAVAVETHHCEYVGSGQCIRMCDKLIEGLV